MDEAIFRTKLDRLRAGEMSLPPQEQNEIGAHARKNLPDLMEYTAAVEAGYRILMERLGTYRNIAGERALGRIVRNQWSSPAVLGYAAAALRQTMIPSQVVGVLKLMEELMDKYPRAWAEGVYEEMIDDPGGEGNGRPGNPSTGLEAGPPPLQAGEVKAAPARSLLFAARMTGILRLFSFSNRALSSGAMPRAAS